VSLFLAFGVSPSGAQSALQWQGWEKSIFERAGAEKRFVLLDLEAVWCHWCHVMEQTTYADPKVVALIKERFLPVRVDQDANPDLSNRYGAWGWPATIIFSPEGEELAKLRGYLPPERMASLLQAFIDDPTPGPSVIAAVEHVPAQSTLLAEGARMRLERLFKESYDTKNGGWGTFHKYIDGDSMELALTRAEQGHSPSIAMVAQTLDAALLLFDREWGGVYQYSDQPDWRSPHFEKIMWYQAQYLRQYSQAYAIWHDPRHLEAAGSIFRYVTTHLSSPEGAFFTSQDADLDERTPGRIFYALSDSERRKLGRAPRIDTNIYARENGWAISGLVAYFNVTNYAAALERAERAGQWVLANRRLSGGGFSHGANDRGGPFAGDSLAMGQAALDLYAATGKREWLKAAGEAGDFIAATFKDARGGYLTSQQPEAAVGVLAEPTKLLDEQLALARFFNRLHRYLGRASDRTHAEHALRYVLSETVLATQRPLPGLLLAVDEFAAEPTHITIVGRKDDERAMALHAAGRAIPALYKRLDWWDKREGPLPNPDVTYPELDEAAAFACSQRICSLPTFDADGLKSAIALMKEHSPPQAVR
jgi:uncharacterized protein YyaL (SSP411 family)